MKRILLLLIAATILAVAQAERIDGPANIRNQPKGDIIFSLHDNVDVETSESDNGWFQILIMVKISREQYDSHPTLLKKGTKLFNMKGEEIGIALQDILPDGTMSAGGAPGNPKWYAAEVLGYTFESNIRPQSIIEPVVSALVQSSKPNLTRKAFEKHMKDFGYQDGLAIRDMPEYDTFMVYESTLDDPSPLDRIRLIFHRDKLVAIVHSRHLNLTGYETVSIDRGRKLTLLHLFDDKEKLRFIKNNNESYGEVD